VIAGDRVLVSDGRRLHVLSLATQKLATRAPIPFRPDDAGGPEALRGADARHAWGLIEGFGLTVAGDDVYANVPASGVGCGDRPGTPPDDIGDGPPGSGRDAPWRSWDDAVCAVRLEGDGGRVRWIAGGGAATPGLPERLRLLGTPLLYRGAVHVTGLRPTKANAADDLLEAWHVALDPATGAVRSAVYLGNGSPVRRGRVDEAMPPGCVGAHGRVHVVTAIGIAAAVDARTGRTLWSYRYDRGRPDGEDVAKRLTGGPERAPRRTTFANLPPILADGRVFLAPTDGRLVHCLSDRPRGRTRVLTRWKLRRTDDVRNLAIEQLVGVTEAAGDVPPTLVAVGQATRPAARPLHLRRRRGREQRDPAVGARAPFGGIPEPFGLATVAGDDVFVPTAKGIARYALADGADRPSIEAPADDGTEEAYGNPLSRAGRGLSRSRPPA
jgi:hypothetical protein